MKKETRISISIFIAYSLLICFFYDFDFTRDASQIFLWIFPILSILLYDFAIDKTTFYNALRLCGIWSSKFIVEIFKFIFEIIRDFCRSIWHWFISIVPGGIIVAIGLYFNSVFHQDWIWNICITLASIITVILFTYNTRND